MVDVMADLRGKKVLIVGGAKRIGREIALALARAGTDVAITYRNSKKEAKQTAADIAALGVRGMALECDIHREAAVKKIVARAIRTLGGIDILVNNAGVYETVEFEKITLRQWDETFATNARGPFLVSQAAVSELRKRKGRIINVGSLGGMRPWSSHAHYCASKAALHMLTQSMAKALAPEISVNCVAPGMIDLNEMASSALLRRFAARTPMKRNGTADDIAAAVMFFATAPSFITGQIMAVDGGLGLL